MEVSFLYKLENLEETADLILEHLDKKKLILFYGEMGSGKTTLIKLIFRKLNIKDDVSSPTFSIVNEYETFEKSKMYHFDLYRLKDLSELESIGFNEYLRKGSLSIVEWPEIAVTLFSQENALHVRLFHHDLSTRKIIISN